jgi:hypothetical protein
MQSCQCIIVGQQAIVSQHCRTPQAGNNDSFCVHHSSNHLSSMRVP